jgi:ribosomal protein S18 acetylase RimI-like enzyme
MNIKIREVRSGEIKKLAEIGKTTFEEAFSKDNNPDDMKKYLTESFNPDQILKEFNIEGSFFYFAEIKNQIAGYLKINAGDAQNENFNPNWMEIERIYVLRKFQSKGIGKRMVDFALKKADKHHSEFVWLGVWENNLTAKYFYRKLGFEPFSKHTFVLGSDPQTDILMKIDVRDHKKAVRKN